MSERFKGRKLLVVGGTSGMGMETARMVLAEGGSVVLVGNRADKAEEARQTLSALGPVEVIVANLSTDEGLQSLLKTLEAQHADIDLLVNAAGVFFPKPFLEHTPDDYDLYMKFNRAIYFITQKVAAQLVAAGRPGAIVNIGSMWAQQAIAATPSSAYSMAKAGLHALTQQLAMELAPSHIRVNAVSPAVVQTPITKASFRRPRCTARCRVSTASTRLVGWVPRTMWPRSLLFCCLTRQAGSPAPSGMSMVG